MPIFEYVQGVIRKLWEFFNFMHCPFSIENIFFRIGITVHNVHVICWQHWIFAWQARIDDAFWCAWLFLEWDNGQALIFRMKYQVELSSANFGKGFLQGFWVQTKGLWVLQTLEEGCEDVDDDWRIWTS